MAPSSPTNAQSHHFGDSNAQKQVKRQLRPESTIVKRRSITSLFVKERDFAPSLESEEFLECGSNSPLSENEFEPCNEEAFELQEVNFTMGNPHDSSPEDFAADPFGDEPSVSNELEAMIDSCDEDVSSGCEGDDVEGCEDLDFSAGECSLEWMDSSNYEASQPTGVEEIGAVHADHDNVNTFQSEESTELAQEIAAPPPLEDM
mmetsp:Transcript_18855/g.38348  ORF Transcript_18855/g.38348 Transcript_18855/m.38348 type:complete len:204 (+) Transcript_18855:57-668(+)|eukprot:CAMPEP_0181318640 /NCGR_PEP_ID=MMETSP1101-20121128/17117_1 /TAXON_ID=46948 /ORGANISM="Rhodomonas abbreviata, Strain Caron Lab Isolate" /LENGTH=203 /DNA_ID=CAMNT_0023426129 /DNA_START=57 /DNA_END=668 /DNA_ORIENTATION=-